MPNFADRYDDGASVEDVVIYGAGGFGAEVQDILRQGTRYRPIAYLDSDSTLHGRLIGGLRVVGGLSHAPALCQAGVHAVVVAIGDNATRAACAETLELHGMTLISAIHPLASISPSAHLANHVIIGPRAILCVHARVGRHAVLSAGAIAEHDNSIGVGAFLGPAVRLAGTVTIEDFARLEIGATVIPGRKVGRGALVEAGAVVIRDVPPNRSVAGVPAGERAASRFASSRLPADGHVEPADHAVV